jgi:hypothetical protein
VAWVEGHAIEANIREIASLLKEPFGRLMAWVAQGLQFTTVERFNITFVRRDMVDDGGRGHHTARYT